MTNRATGWVAPKDQYAVPVMFSPYTGEPRDVRDVQSDPQGVLIVPPGKVDMLATPAAQAADSVQEDAGGANWQDISTAPKDGTRFVAVGQNYGLDSEKQHTCIAQWLAGCWVEVSDWNGASKLKYLTHWMPLPPLPCSAGRKQGANHD